MESQTNRTYWLKTGRDKRPGRPEAAVKHQTKSDPQRAIFCKVCGEKITTPKQAITVTSSFRHTFFNPAGIIFELGCYKRAVGCRVVGIPSSEFSWFSGYLWSFALCSGCQTHLGWYFESESDGFWGLILNKLKE